jgi:hypothetical protein
MRRGGSSIFINAFQDLLQHVSASHCHHQGVVVAETCWGKSRKALIKILLHPRRSCWLFYNNTTRMLGPAIKILPEMSTYITTKSTP